MTERWREPVATLPTAEHLDAKERQGWKPIAIEWIRDREPSEPDALRRPIPYGLRISSDCSCLEVDPVEKEVMSVVIAMIAGDHPLSKIAEELNTRELRTREGTVWTQVGIFKMLPRIVEFGPEILSAHEWSDSKRKLLAAVS